MKCCVISFLMRFLVEAEEEQEEEDLTETHLRRSVACGYRRYCWKSARTRWKINWFVVACIKNKLLLISRKAHNVFNANFAVQCNIRHTVVFCVEVCSLLHLFVYCYNILKLTEEVITLFLSIIIVIVIIFKKKFFALRRKEPKGWMQKLNYYYY